MKAAIPLLRKQFQEKAVFDQVYKYAFKFALMEPNQKVLALETAVAYWELLLAGRFHDLELWIQFLKEKHSKGISRDTWNLFLDFINGCEENYASHDLTGAW